MVYSVIDHARGEAFVEDSWDGCGWATALPCAELRSFATRGEAEAWASSVPIRRSEAASTAAMRAGAVAFACERCTGGVGVGAALCGPELGWRGHRFVPDAGEGPAAELHAVALALEALSTLGGSAPRAHLVGCDRRLRGVLRPAAHAEPTTAEGAGDADGDGEAAGEGGGSDARHAGLVARVRLLMRSLPLPCDLRGAPLPRAAGPATAFAAAAAPPTRDSVPCGAPNAMRLGAAALVQEAAGLM